MLKHLVASALSIALVVGLAVPAFAQYSATEKQLAIPIKMFNFSLGTWTFTNSTGLFYVAKSTTDETPVVTVPISIPRESRQFGTKLKYIKMPYRLTGAAFDAAPSCKVYRTGYDLVTSGADGDSAATEVPSTNDGVVTLNAKDRLLTITVTNPAWDYTTQATATYNVTCSLDAGASSVIRLYDAVAVFETLE